MMPFLRKRIRSITDKKFAKTLKHIMGFRPRRISIYETAFVHKSASYKNDSGLMVNNERLEYLGDAILDAVVADYLYQKYPGESEGFLTQARSRIVNGTHLNQIAQRMGFRKIIIANLNKGAGRKRIYEDTLEALIGAIYLDRGYKKASDFILNEMLKKYIDVDEVVKVDKNYKSQLIEWAQRNKQNLDFFTDQEYPGSKYFASYVRLQNDIIGQGSGVSKKEAEQRAAKDTLNNIKAHKVMLIDPYQPEPDLEDTETP